MKIIKNIKKRAEHLFKHPYIPEYEINRLKSFFNPVSFKETKEKSIFGSNFFSIGTKKEILDFCQKEGISYKKELENKKEEEKILFGINTENILYINLDEDYIINYNLYFFKI